MCYLQTLVTPAPQRLYEASGTKREPWCSVRCDFMLMKQWKARTEVQSYFVLVALKRLTLEINFECPPFMLIMLEPGINIT
jgi:hypothetical protein